MRKLNQKELNTVIGSGKHNPEFVPGLKLNTREVEMIKIAGDKLNIEQPTMPTLNVDLNIGNISFNFNLLNFFKD